MGVLGFRLVDCPIRSRLEHKCANSCANNRMTADSLGESWRKRPSTPIATRGRIKRALCEKLLLLRSSEMGGDSHVSRFEPFRVRWENVQNTCSLCLLWSAGHEGLAVVICRNGWNRQKYSEEESRLLGSEPSRGWNVSQSSLSRSDHFSTWLRGTQGNSLFHKSKMTLNECKYDEKWWFLRSNHIWQSPKFFSHLIKGFKKKHQTLSCQTVPLKTCSYGLNITGWTDQLQKSVAFSHVHFAAARTQGIWWIYQSL